MSFETKRFKQHFWFLTHRIHVWYICLHLVDFYGFHVGKYTSPMDGMAKGFSLQTISSTLWRLHPPSDSGFAPRISQLHLILRIHVVGHRCPNLVDQEAHKTFRTKKFFHAEQKQIKSRWSKFPLIMNPMFFCEWFFSFNGVSNPHFVPLQQWPNGQTTELSINEVGPTSHGGIHGIDTDARPCVCVVCAYNPSVPLLKNKNKTVDFSFNVWNPYPKHLRNHCIFTYMNGWLLWYMYVNIYHTWMVRVLE